MWRFPIQQLHTKQVDHESFAETLSRGPWFTTTGGSVDDEFIQTRELQMAGPAIQEKFQACNGISHLPRGFSWNKLLFFQIND